MKKITLATIGFMLANMAVAQTQMNPDFDIVLAPTNPSENTFTPSNLISRLTGSQQRPTTDTKEQIIYSIGSLNGVKTDSTSFVFVGENRFSYPPNDQIYTTSQHDFDTSFRFTNASGSNNFASLEVKEYDADNRIIKSSLYDEQGNLSNFTDYEYYPDGILKRYYYKEIISATDSFIAEQNYSPSGKILLSYRNQDVPSFGAAYWFRQKTTYSYDGYDRRTNYSNTVIFPANFTNPNLNDSATGIGVYYYDGTTTTNFYSSSELITNYNQGVVSSSSFDSTNFTYDNNGNLIEYISFTNNQLSKKTTYNYNSTNQVVESVTFDYNLGSQNWENSKKSVYSYNNDIQTENISYTWYGSNWVMQSQSINTLNTNGLVDSIKNIRYDLNETITNKTLEVITYTDLANVKQVININEDLVNNNTTERVVFNLYRTIEITGIDAILNDVSLSIYPNPARDLINIRLSLTEEDISDWTLVVSNVEGRVIMSDKVNEKMEINTASWNAGIYFMTFRNNQNQQMITKQVVKF